jgi:hypothetical protein
MRLAFIAVGLLSVSSLKICESDKDKAPSAEGAQATGAAEVTTTSAARADAKARFGGHVTKVGDNLVEVVVHKNGNVHAWVTDLEGKTIASPAKAKVKVKLTAKGGAKPDVALAWQEPEGRFVGKADAGVDLEAAPIEVSLDLDGKARTGAIAEVALVGEAEHGGNVVAAGNYSVELLVAPKGKVEAFVKTAAGAKVDGSANLDLKVKLPDVSGKAQVIALAWVPARARFEGKVDGDVELAPGPLEVTVDAKAGAKIGGMERIALNVDASHGGRIVAVGDYSVELVALGDGLVAAYVFDASGKAQVQGDVDLNINIGGADVKFEWDAPSLSYHAKVAANVDIHAVPLKVSLKAKGKAHVAFVAALDAKARADLRAAANLNAKVNAKADAVAKAGADLKAKLDVKPPKVEVKAPSVNLNVQKSASASAGASTNTQAKAGATGGAKAGGGFSFGTK